MKALFEALDEYGIQIHRVTQTIALVSFVCVLFMMLMNVALQGQSRKSGYYKDLFMDGGIGLNEYDDLPAAKFLNLTMERISTFENGDTTAATAYEHMLMSNAFIGSEIDCNGSLLYPDGAPRFRVIP